jgi:hypothetical protein
MTTKRRPLNRSQHPPITLQMVELFARSCAIQEVGDHLRWGGDQVPGRRREFLDIETDLNIRLLKQPWHAVSVLDPALDGQRPRYMDHLASGQHWHVSVQLRQALLTELRYRQRVESEA